MTSKHSDAPYICSEIIQKRRPSFKPIIGLVLGSGLGDFVNQLENSLVIPYEELPGFPQSQIQGHSGNLVLGSLGGVDLVCLQGRAHSYEGDNNETVKTYVRTLRLLGCEYFLATNASGSLHQDVAPGQLMIIADHINFQPTNPLVGPNDDRFGPRFYPLDNAYDKAMREKLLSIALNEKIMLHQGVYISVLGPNYETAAEIKAFRLLGADVVGMSTVPEVLVANHCGMRVAVISVVSNYATGLNTENHSHEAVLSMAAEGGQSLNVLLKAFISSLTSQPTSSSHTSRSK